MSVLPGFTGIIGAPTTSTAAITFTDSGSTNPPGGTSHSITGLSFGAAATDRYIIAVVGGLNNSGVNGVVSGVTIGGVTATSVVATTTNDARAAIFIAAVPTGTSGTVVITYNTDCTASGAAVFRAVGLNSPVADGTSSSLSESLSPVSMNVTYITGGYTIGGGQTSSSAVNSWAWTGLTEVVEVDVRSDDKFSAALGTTGTVTNDLSGSIVAAARVVASFH